jgi:hypothetical protein
MRPRACAELKASSRGYEPTGKLEPVSKHLATAMMMYPEMDTHGSGWGESEKRAAAEESE